VVLSRDSIASVVSNYVKQRFAMSEDGRRIRVSQGTRSLWTLRSYPEPPENLYHGTATHFLDSIRTDGLKPMNRQHVHLPADEATATAVGQRHGKPFVLRIRSGEIGRARRTFFLSGNGVWLTGRVDAASIYFR
jgi:putative RNA 2'-phosphotransferase